MSLWIYSQIKTKISYPHRRIKKTPVIIQRTSFCTCSKGSYTLEAAVVIPLVAMYLVTIVWFFILLQVQCVVDEAVLYAGRKTAVESSIVESEDALFLSAEAYLFYALQDSSLVEKYVQNGTWGIQLWKSKFSGEEIYLRAEYTVTLPISLWGIGEIKLVSQNCFQKWLGDQSYEKEGEYVYVTTYGTVYHRNLACRSIQLSVNTSTLEHIPHIRGKDGQCYYECGRCNWPDDKKERVYYTDYGTLYHKDIGCSAIKRMVEKIELKDVGEKYPCSFCYGL